MSVTLKVLIPAKMAEAAQTTQYAAINLRAIVDKFTATNTTAGALTLTVNLVTSGDAASADNTVVKTVNIGAGLSYTFPEVVGHVLEAGGLISTLASATGISIRASGREVT
jgi:hypothetical protein